MIIFSCTEEAIAYGNRPLSEKVIKHLKESEIHFRKFYKYSIDRGMELGDIREFNSAMVFATKAQFCREALETYYNYKGEKI